MASVLSPQTFVVDSETLGANNICRAVLGFRNLLSTESVTLGDPDPNYPLELAYDFRTNTEYSPAISSGSVQILITNSDLQSVNYFGIFSKNAGDCGLSVTIEILNQLTGLYEIVGTISNFKNAKPEMVYWKDKTTYSQRITLSFTSKCFISTISLGKAIVFSRTVSTGYQPARNASLDEVSNFSTEGNDFVQGRRISNGFQEKAPVNYQTYGFVDLWWTEFMNHVLDSKPLFFMANNQKPENCVFGLQNPQSLTKPSFKNKQHCDLDFEIRGWA